MNISRKMSVLVTSCVLLVLLPSLWIYYHYSKQVLLESTLNNIQLHTLKKVENYQRFIQLATPELKALAQLLKSELVASETGGDKLFDQRMMQFEDGAWRNISAKFDGKKQAGLFLPSDSNLTAKTKQFYATAMTLLDDFGLSATSNPIFDNIWMLGHDRSKLIFDVSYPDFIYLMADDTDYTTTPWMLLASPESNPNRGARWTPALLDPVSEKWMTSVIYPLDINGEWQASLGIDLELDRLFSLLELKSGDYEHEEYFVLDQNGKFILAGPWQEQVEKNTDFDLDSSEQGLKNSLKQSLTSDAEILEPIIMKGIEYQVVASRIEPMGWTSYRLIPTEEILRPLFKQMVSTLFLILFMTIVLGVLINTAVCRLVVDPLLQITERVRSYILGNKPSVEIIDQYDEVGELSDAFRTMHDKLTQDAKQLLDSEQRYHHVITNINEALVQINSERCWQFLSPVWKDLSGYDVQYSLHKPVGDFFHLADQSHINQILDSLFNNKQNMWNGEVRLRLHNKRYSWVNLSLQRSDGDIGECSISGTVEDIHINYVSRELNQLIRTAEQMVLSSHCSVITILEFLTQELVTILAIPLTWVKICQDHQGQILSHAGELSDFLFDNNKTWSGLHKKDSPVIEAVKQHVVVRVTTDNMLSQEWQQRLNNDEIKDSLFLPFYLAGGETHAVIGLHSYNQNTFDDDFQQIMTDFSLGLRLVCQMAEDQNLMRLHQTALEKTANAIMITDNYGKIEWVNDAFIKLTLFQNTDVLGKTPELLNSNTKESTAHIKEMWKIIKTGNVWSGEIVNRRKDGAFISVYQTITPLVDDLGDITHYISVSEDVTERNENLKQIAFMATHDELTSLPNRTLLDDRLNQAIAHAKRQQIIMAVLFIDIDHFKYINDSLGHQVGDALLKTLASRLHAVLREEDTIARFGGDEFVIVLPDVADINDIKLLASNLLNEIKKPYEIMSHELMITGSIGISFYPNDASNADELIQQADSAMYKAKELGRNNSQFYTSAINEKITRRLSLEKALRKAVQLKQFVLYYQPKVDLKTNKITGVEALIRWEHPELGLVPPIEFIPLAEETGIILDIGDWVIVTACTQMKQWEQDYPNLKNMAINVSARQFWQEDFITRISSILSETKVTVNKIEFELTESIVMDDSNLAITMMSKLKNIGVSLSIDDFGTGYSSLSYLQKFPVDTLKIDRAFVNDLDNEKSDSAIIRSIMALADNFSLRVVAEGIEEKYQKEILTTLGCQYGQGYYFSRPISSTEMSQKLFEDK